MKNPPLLPSLFAVMLLAVLNVQLKESRLAEHGFRDLFALTAAVVVGAGVALKPRMTKKSGDGESRRDDDLDLSA